MKKCMFIILALLVALTSVGCSNSKSEITETITTTEETEKIEATEETSFIPTMVISKTSDTGYYFACVDFVEEFTDLNEGGFEYYEDTNEIRIGVTKSTGTHTGCLEGPTLEFTVNLITEEVTDKKYTPQPDDEENQVYRPDNDELDKMSEERLIEVAKMFYEKMSSDEIDMSNYEANNKKLTAETTTEETEITTAQTSEIIEKEVKEEENKRPYLVSPENAKLLCFCGCFDYGSPYNKFQTLNSDSINNFINELNKIDYTSYEKSEMSGGGNWCEGFWDVMIYKDGVKCYDIHTENDMIYIIDNTIDDENPCTILRINNDVRHEFEKKVFDFNNDEWDEYVNSEVKYLDEIRKIDTFAGTCYDESKWTVLVAGNDFTSYKVIENKYTKYHDFKKRYYKIVKYSYNELQKSSHIIKEKMKDYSVYDVGISMKNNMLEVYMIEDNEEYKKAIIELSSVKNIEFFDYTESTRDINPST